MIEKLSKSSFEPYLHEKFEAHPKGGEKVELELVEVKDASTEMVDSFHLLFRGPKDRVFHHNTHRIRHRKLGEFDLFLGPIVHGATDGVYYQAVFSRLRAVKKAAKKTPGKIVKKIKKVMKATAGKKSSQKSSSKTKR